MCVLLSVPPSSYILNERIHFLISHVNQSMKKRRNSGPIAPPAKRYDATGFARLNDTTCCGMCVDVDYNLSMKCIDGDYSSKYKLPRCKRHPGMKPEDYLPPRPRGDGPRCQRKAYPDSVSARQNGALTTEVPLGKPMVPSLILRAHTCYHCSDPDDVGCVGKMDSVLSDGTVDERYFPVSWRLACSTCHRPRIKKVHWLLPSFHASQYYGVTTRSPKRANRGR